MALGSSTGAAQWIYIGILVIVVVFMQFRNNETGKTPTPPPRGPGGKAPFLTLFVWAQWFLALYACSARSWCLTTTF